MDLRDTEVHNEQTCLPMSGIDLRDLRVVNGVKTPGVRGGETGGDGHFVQIHSVNGNRMHDIHDVCLPRWRSGSASHLYFQYLMRRSLVQSGYVA
jgi:hypothetical protein